MRGGSWTAPSYDPRQPFSNLEDDSLCRDKGQENHVDLCTSNRPDNIYLQWGKKFVNTNYKNTFIRSYSRYRNDTYPAVILETKKPGHLSHLVKPEHHELSPPIQLRYK